jgi:hypothetical protein
MQEITKTERFHSCDKVTAIAVMPTEVAVKIFEIYAKRIKTYN